MGKLKSFADRVGIKAREVKFAVGTMAASAAVPVVTVMASAEDGTTTGTGLTQYSEQITSTFSNMVDQVMPIVIGILGAGVSVFGLFLAFKLARKALGTVAK